MDDRCKNVPIKPCCADMEDILMLNDIRESVLFDPDATRQSGHRFMLWWRDCDCTPLRYCPSCGAIIQDVNEVAESRHTRYIAYKGRTKGRRAYTSASSDMLRILASQGNLNALEELERRGENDDQEDD